MVRSQSWRRFSRDVEGLYTDLGRRPLTRCKLRQVLSELGSLRDENGRRLIKSTTQLIAGHTQQATTALYLHGDARNFAIAAKSITYGV
jgi:hypothetical protein